MTALLKSPAILIQIIQNITFRDDITLSVCTHARDHRSAGHKVCVS